MILVIILVIISVIVLYNYIKNSLKNKRETITCYTGTMGSGKSLFSVQDTLSAYNYVLNEYYFRKFLAKIGVKKYKDYLTLDKPLLFSTIPVLINKRKQIYSTKLTLNHLLLQEQIPQRSIVFIDEIGNFASQFDFKNPNILNAFNEFIRLFRHYVNGYIICNEQSSNFVELHIRSRINTIHNLSNCFVLWRFCFYYDRQINISEEKITTIDMKNNISNSDTQDNKKLKFRFLKYTHRYNSRCYKKRYDNLPISNFEKYNSLYTNNMITCPKDKIFIQKTNGKEEK